MTEAWASLGRTRGASERRRRIAASFGDSSPLGTDDALVFVAAAGEHVVGFSLVSLAPPTILALHTIPNARRQGVASAIIEQVRRELAARGVPDPSVIASAGDRAEKSLFEKLAYRAELLVMSRRLDSTD